MRRALLAFCLLSAPSWGQQAVTTPSGTTNQVAKFGAPSSVVNSSITDVNGNVGIGTSNPQTTLQVNGNILLTGQPTQELSVTGSATSGRFGQDALGVFIASDSPAAAFRVLIHSGPGLSEALRVTAGGVVQMSSPPFAGQVWQGQAAFGPDSADSAQSFIGEAGDQVHFRLSRSTPEVFGNPTAQNLLVAPYDYGMGIEYPSTIEVWSRNFSVHQNHQQCNPADIGYLIADSCVSSAHFWIGDIDDTGGWFGAAYDALNAQGTIDRSQSFVVLASDTFDHTSHGDMLFVLRDPADNFRFQVGGTGAADDPQAFRSYTKARIDSTGKGFFDGGTQIGGADFAESVAVGGKGRAYEPGDVLAIDPDSDRSVVLSHSAYSTLVAGIYSTKPGVLGSQHGSEDPRLADEIPVAIVGIVPCKVTTENGPIARGDLLVSSSTPGYAMRGDDRAKLTGAVVGKAMQPFTGSSGKIEVLVSLR